MASLARQIWDIQPLSVLFYLPVRFLDGVLRVVRLLLGIQEGPCSTEPFDESSHPRGAETKVQATNAIGEEYCPPVERNLAHGSTSIVGRIGPGVVLKYPRYLWPDCSKTEIHEFIQDIRHSFHVEEQILHILGEHPSIIKFLGSSKDPRGLLFAEANGGNLQDYLDRHHDTIDDFLRVKWRTQVAEAIGYLHLKGVIHSDLRPANCLLHTDASGDLNLYLSDFGGSTCGALDGGHLPDSGFFDPRKPWVSTEDTDIFSLGSVFYTIMTGHWPYRGPGPFESVAEKERYEEKVDTLFSRCEFPEVETLLGGVIIQNCWTGRYKDVQAIEAEQTLILKEYVR